LITWSLWQRGHCIFSSFSGLEDSFYHYLLGTTSTLPRNIIAFHEDHNRYHYAVITVAGHIIEVGDVVVPSHVHRPDDEIYYSDAYVHELANAMVALAKSYNAFIALEDISARKNRPTTSRKQNRERFANPFGKLVQFLNYKALQAGLPAPHLTRGVRYRDTCGQCGPALPAGTATIHRGAAKMCAVCQAVRPGTYVSVPALLHAASIVYHIPGVERLQLSGRTLANIFLGVITRWNHAEIAADNPGVQLPDLPIVVIRETDTPITVSVVSNYLRSMSPEWSRRANTRKRLLWSAKEEPSRTPVEVVREIEGAIGLIAWTRELEHESGIVAIKNNAETFVTPSLESISAGGAVLASELFGDEPLTLPETSNDNGIYPLTGVTWMSIAKEQVNWQQAHKSVRFLYWLLTEGSQQAIHQGHFPVPESIHNLAMEQLQQVTVGGQIVFKVGQEDSDSHDSFNMRGNDHPVHAVVIRQTGVGAAAPIPLYQQWSEQYRHTTPHANIVFQRVPPHLEDASVIRRQTTRRNTARFDQQVHNQNRPTCTVCGTVCSDGDFWSDCIRCDTNIEAKYNRSIVVARKTLEQLVDRYQIVVERREAANEDLIEGDDQSIS
jgi:phosphate transport system substrate-binding protein